MASSSSVSELTSGGSLVQAPTQEDLRDDPDTLIVGDFHINVHAHHATLRGQDLRLTPEEFELLIFLFRHRKSVITPHTRVSKRFRNNQVCQADFMRVLGELRDKLEHVEGSSHYIRTEPWVVCQFDPYDRGEAH
jgi:DNA-binding response OmpR family regulator